MKWLITEEEAKQKALEVKKEEDTEKLRVQVENNIADNLNKNGDTEDLLKYLNPFYLSNGRIDRLGFVFGMIFTIIILFIIYFIVFATLGAISSIADLGNTINKESNSGLELPLILGGLLIIYIFAISSIQLTIRRLHDLGYSGWYSIIGHIPYLGLIQLIILMFLKGDKEKNEFGYPIIKSASPIDIFFNKKSIYNKENN